MTMLFKRVFYKSEVSPIRWVILITLCFAAFQLPFSSFMADDFIQIGVLEGVSPAKWLGPFDLYSIADGNPEHMKILKDKGAFQWFWNPEFKLRSFRLLSSILLALDHVIFGLNPLGYGIHNIFWFLLFIIPSCLIFKKCLPERIRAMAIFIFVLSGVHWQVMYWTATRHITIAASLGLWSLLAYIKWRDENWKKGYVLAIFGFFIALLGGETALSVMSFLFAFELLITSQTLKKKLTNLFPFILMGIIYVIIYRLMDFGAHGGSGYLNPFVEPIQFFISFPKRFIVLAGSMFWGGHADLWANESIRPYLILFALLIIITVFVVFKKVHSFMTSKEMATIKWTLTGSFISMIIFSTAPPGVRFLIVPFIGSSIIISSIICIWWTILKKSFKSKLNLFSIICWVLIFIHLMLAPIQRLAGPWFIKKTLVDRLESVLKNGEFNNYPMPQKLVFITVPDFIIGLHSFYYRKLKRDPMPESWWILSWEDCDHRLYRHEDNSLRLELIKDSIRGSFLKKGTRIRLSGMEAIVLKANEKGATLIEFNFDRSLNDPSMQFVAWKNNRLKNIRLPQIGKSIILPRKKHSHYFRKIKK